MRVYLEAFGCSQNLGEGAALRRSLAEAGHPIVSAPEGADVGVIVTCGVIGSTEARMVRRWEALASRIPRVVVTGCLVPLRRGLFTGPGSERTLHLPIRSQHELPALLEQWGGGSTPVEPATPAEPDATAEVVLAQGCTSHCTYCFSRLARGRLTSVAPLDVLARVAAARDRGAVEIRLSSLDTSCWGMDLPESGRLPALAESITRLPGDFRVRVGMMSPQSLAPIAGPYLDAVRGSRFFHFLHLPVQSGSNSVLSDMRRGYSVQEFLALVVRARDALPDLMLSTDVIVGFPTEGESDHEATIRLLETVDPEIVNVTRFSARPMTPAARLPQLPPGIVKRRSREITRLRLRRARARLERWVGRQEEALIVEHGPNGSRIGRLPNYLPVVVRQPLPLRSRVSVRIDGARSTYLVGEPAGPSDLFSTGMSV